MVFTMKKLTLILLILSIQMMAQWEQIAPAPTSYNLTTVCALTSSKALVAGQSGFLGITTDRGASWTTKIWATRQDFLDGDFCDENKGLLSSRGAIIKTTDGGDSWEKIYNSPDAEIIKVRMFDDLNFAAVTDKNFVLRTTNGGESWQISVTVPERKFHAASILDMNRMFILADSFLVSTSDGGQTFSSKPVILPVLGWHQLDVVHFFDSMNGIASRHGGGGFKTTDGGETWSMPVQPSAYIPSIHGIHGRNSRAMIAGEFRYIMKTSDSGITWNSFTPGPEKILLDVSSFDENVWFASGEAGAFQSTTDFGATWQYRQSSTTDKNILNIDFFDDSTGLIGYGWGLSKTTNGGYDWSVVSTNLPLIYEMSFIDKQVGCFIASDSIFRTTDGGVTFTKTWSMYGLQVVYVAPNGRVFAGGSSGRLVVSSDSGATWSYLNSLVTSNISTIQFLDSLTGYFVSSNKIGKTTDGGDSWNVSQFSFPGGLYKFFFFDETEGIGFSETRTYITRDGGLTWSLVLTAPSTIRDLMRDGENGAIMCCLYGRIYTSQDRGLTWQLNEPVTSTHLRIMTQTPGGTVFIGGDKGTVIKESPESNVFTGIEDKRIEIPKSFTLSQNYPNPFNPETVIRFSLPEAGYVKGVVYDILGREVATLLKGDMPTGNHQVKFNAKGIASGVYVFRLEAGNYSSAIKMVVNK